MAVIRSPLSFHSAFQKSGVVFISWMVLCCLSVVFIAPNYSASPVPSFTKAIARCNFKHLRQVLHSISHAKMQTPQSQCHTEMAISSGGQDLPGKGCRFPCNSCPAFCKLRFHIALRECAASFMPAFAQGDSSQAIRPALALPIPSRHTPRYRIANLPAMLPLANRFAHSTGILAQCSAIDYCCLYHVIV